VLVIVRHLIEGLEEWGLGGGKLFSFCMKSRGKELIPFMCLACGGTDSDSRPTKEDRKRYSSPGEPNIGRLLTELSEREIEIYTKRWEDMDDDEIERVWDEIRSQSQLQVLSRSSERGIGRDLPPSSPPSPQPCEPSTDQVPCQDRTPVTPKPPQTFLRRTSTLKNIKAIRSHVSSSSSTPPSSSDHIDPIGLRREERRGEEKDLFPPSPPGWNAETNLGNLRGTGMRGMEYEPFRIVCKVARLLERRCLILDRENEELRRRLGGREEREREVDLDCDQVCEIDSAKKSDRGGLTGWVLSLSPFAGFY
jgi:hypothetical protein